MCESSGDTGGSTEYLESTDGGDLMNVKLTTPLVLLLIAAGCGGQIGEENVGSGTVCELQESTALAEEDATELGSTVAELRAWIDGEHTSTMSWIDNTESALSITVATSGSATWDTYAPAANGDGEQPAIEIGCTPDLSFPATLTVTTDDGRLNETWTGSITLPGEPTARFHTEVTTLSGTLDPESFAADADYDAFAAHFSTTVREDGAVQGELMGTTEGTTGTGPDSAAWQSVVPIGTFGEDANEQ